MATTLTHLETVRRVLRGVSGPQPLAGTAQRAADAYAAMMAAEWTESGDGPSVPPHHFDRASPMPGDAYRQTWGYDKAKRTERSACGAVCYSVRLPADALSGEACGIASVSANVFGDRYLECGAILTAILSEDAVPPAWDAILADGASTSAILVPAATDAHGNMIEPNKRADTSATATLPVGEPATAWLHLVLRVADYLAARDAWHEGGAMLDPESVFVTFSRDVAADDTSVIARWTQPEEELGGEAALSRAAVVFGSVSWPTGICAGLPAPVLWDAVDDAMRLPFVAAENVFNGHHCARLGRWPDASGTLPQGDWAAVGAVEERWSGQSFPWVCGFVLGLRVHLRGGARSFSRLHFGVVPAAPGLVVRAAAYLAGDPPASSSGLRLSTPDASRLDWSALFAGTAESLPLCGAEGAAMPLAPAGAARIDLADGADGMPVSLRVADAATIVLAVAPVAPESYACVNWPLCDWVVS